MKRGRIALTGVVIVVLAFVLARTGINEKDDAQASTAPVPVLSVVLTRAEVSMLPIRVPATGNVAAWQEASVGAEVDGLRLIEVRVNVGDMVKRDQVLAVLNPDIVEAELAEVAAAVVLAEAEARDAETNSWRAKELEGSGAMSAQQISQYIASAAVARARLEAARAVEQRNRLRLAQTRVLAPSDGVITSRTATVGAVVPAGQEMFRLIRDGRLEWRAEVAMRDMDKLAPGQSTTISLQGHPSMQGRLRMIAPAIDTQTHNGLVYVDLPRDSQVRAGAFARGYFEVGGGPALTVPQSAVLLRDGFNYVMQVGPASNVMMKKVEVGRRVGDRIEITVGLSVSEDVIVSGLGFLSEGDTVRVVDVPANENTRKGALRDPVSSDAPMLTRSEG